MYLVRCTQNFTNSFVPCEQDFTNSFVPCEPDFTSSFKPCEKILTCELIFTMSFFSYIKVIPRYVAPVKSSLLSGGTSNVMNVYYLNEVS